MKNKIRLTESDLINLIQKVIKEQEQGSDVFNEYMDALDHIANEFDRDTTEEELDMILNETWQENWNLNSGIVVIYKKVRKLKSQRP